MHPSSLAASDRVRPPRPDHAALGAPPRPSGGPAHQCLALVARARSGVRPTESRGRSRAAVVLGRGDAGGGGPASRGDPRRGVDGRGERGLGRDREELLRRPATRLRRGSRDPAAARLPHDPVLPVGSLSERRWIRHGGRARVRKGGDHRRPARRGGGVLAPACRRALALGRRGRCRDRRGHRPARPAGLSRTQPRNHARARGRAGGRADRPAALPGRRRGADRDEPGRRHRGHPTRSPAEDRRAPARRRGAGARARRDHGRRGSRDHGGR